MNLPQNIFKNITKYHTNTIIEMTWFTIMLLRTMKNRFCLSNFCKASKTKSCIFIEHEIGGHCKCILNWAKKAKSRFYKKQFLTNDVLILVLFPDAEYYCTVCNLSELWKKVVNFVSFNLMHLKLIIKIGTITFAYVRLLNKPCKMRWFWESKTYLWERF